MNRFLYPWGLVKGKTSETCRALGFLALSMRASADGCRFLPEPLGFKGPPVVAGSTRRCRAAWGSQNPLKNLGPNGSGREERSLSARLTAKVQGNRTIWSSSNLDFGGTGFISMSLSIVAQASHGRWEAESSVFHEVPERGGLRKGDSLRIRKEIWGALTNPRALNWYCIHKEGILNPHPS